MYDLGISYTFHFHKENTESSVIFLRNDVLILNGKENKEASAICFEIRIPKKKNKELLRKVPSKIYEVILLWKKTKIKFGLLIFPNIITEQWGLCLTPLLIRVINMIVYNPHKSLSTSLTSEADSLMSH